MSGFFPCTLLIPKNPQIPPQKVLQAHRTEKEKKG